MRRSVALLAGLAGLAMTFGGHIVPAGASTPATEKVTITSRPGTYRTTFKGTVPPGVSGAKGAADKSPCVGNDTAEDTHTIQLSLANSRVYKEANVAFTFAINWTQQVDNTVEDNALNVLGPSGTSVGSSDGGDPSEVVKLTNIDEGPYKMLVCGFSRTIPSDYDGYFEMIVTAKAKKPTAPVAAASPSSASNSSSGGNGSSIPLSPNAPAASPTAYRAAVGAGRVTPTADVNAAAADPATIAAAPSAFRGIGDVTAPQAAPPGVIANKKSITKLPLWVLFASSAVGVALLLMGLFARRRQGLDRPAGTDIVPVLAET
jgi:hypothetical protein